MAHYRPATTGVKTANSKMKAHELSEGVPNIATWGRTRCVLPKVKSLNKSYAGLAADESKYNRELTITVAVRAPSWMTLRTTLPPLDGSPAVMDRSSQDARRCTRISETKGKVMGIFDFLGERGMSTPANPPLLPAQATIPQDFVCSKAKSGATAGAKGGAGKLSTSLKA